MVQLSIINPHTNLPTFARLNFFYVKCPFTDDFTQFKNYCSNLHNQHQHRPRRSADFKRYHLLKPKKITCFNSMFTQATDIFHENILEGTLIFIWRSRPRHPSISKIQQNFTAILGLQNCSMWSHYIHNQWSYQAQQQVVITISRLSLICRISFESLYEKEEWSIIDTSVDIFVLFLRKDIHDMYMYKKGDVADLP